MTDISIRRAEESDLPALLGIYNHYVLHTPINFDIEPRTLAQRCQEWLDTVFARQAANISTSWQGRRAVRPLAMPAPPGSSRRKSRLRHHHRNHGVYCAPDHARRGVGRGLYTVLFDALKGEDIHRAFAGITLPNAGSVGLHEAMGFRPIGTYAEVGRKFGKYWDVGLYLKDMA